MSRITNRVASDEKTAEAFLDAAIETLYKAFKAGESITLPGLDGFIILLMSF